MVPSCASQTDLKRRHTYTPFRLPLQRTQGLWNSILWRTMAKLGKEADWWWLGCRVDICLDWQETANGGCSRKESPGNSQWGAWTEPWPLRLADWLPINRYQIRETELPSLVKNRNLCHATIRQVLGKSRVWKGLLTRWRWEYEGTMCGRAGERTKVMRSSEKGTLVTRSQGLWGLLTHRHFTPSEGGVPLLSIALRKLRKATHHFAKWQPPSHKHASSLRPLYWVYTYCRVDIPKINTV